MISRNSITPWRALRTIGELVSDHRRLAVGAGAQVPDRHRAGRGRLGRAALHLDQAHAAVAGDRQPLVEAEARHFRARGLARLEQRVFRRNVELFAVDDDLAHRSLPVFAGFSAHAGSVAFWMRRHSLLEIIFLKWHSKYLLCRYRL